MIALLAAAALADEEPREEDLFGAAPVARPPVEGPPDVATDTTILGRLMDADDRLAIGGKLYLRTSFTVPDQDGIRAEDVAISSPNLLDLYVDARPNDHVRGYVQARYAHDWTVEEGDVNAYGQALQANRVILDQLWIKVDVADRLYITAGRQRVKWGSGRFWNPTDFLNQQALNPLSEFDERTGVSLLRLHLPIESIGANLYAAGNFDGASTLDGVGGALRGEWAVGPAEIALSAAMRDRTPLRLGADVSAGLWLFDLHAEGAVRRGEGSTRWTGNLDFETFEVPTEEDRSEAWIPQVATGAAISVKYSDEDTFSLGAEYFWNGAGYDDAELYPWLLVNGDFTPFYLGEHYVAAYAYVPEPGGWEDVSFTASLLGNLSDRSYAARLDVSGTVRTWLALNAWAQKGLGASGEFNYALSVPQIDLEIVAPSVIAGVGASVRF